MKRVVVLHKVLWAGRHTKDIYKVVKNLPDDALQSTLAEMNKPYPKWKWEIVGDYNLAKNKDFYAYAEYCLRCATDRYCKDYDSASVGRVMLNSISKE